MHLQDQHKILFTGDSITDCNRGYPIGRGKGLGEGYVAQVALRLAAAHPQVEVLNTGISGNRVIDLQQRWETDVLALQPDVLCILIGINDVWRRFDHPEWALQVDRSLYESTYRELLASVRERVTGLILMTPFYLELDREEPMRRMMDDYGSIVQRLARDFDATYIDLQAIFDTYLQDHPGKSLADDKVHPNRTGHGLITAAVMHALS